MPDFNNCV